MIYSMKVLKFTSKGIHIVRINDKVFNFEALTDI